MFFDRELFLPTRSSAERAPIPAAMWGFALLFFLKAAALALFVTPLWDVPDEVGHFAYVADLADGRGIPRLGSTQIPPELARRWQPETRRPVLNWTAVHPPGYHLAAAPFLVAAQLATRDLDWQVRLTRLASSVFGAAALIVLCRVLLEAGAGPIPSLALAAGVGFIPMYSHLSAGVDQDVLSALVGAVIALFWVRVVRRGATRDVFGLSLALAAAGAVKATALPLALALLALLPRRLASTSHRLAVWAAAAAVSLSTPLLWLARQRRTGVGMGLPSISGRPPRLGDFLRYLSDFPVADHTFKNFFGLIGWSGTGRGSLSWFQISGAFLAPFLAASVLLTVAAAIWIARRDRERGRSRSPSARAGWTAAVLVLAGAALVLAGRSAGPGAFAKSLVYALLVAVPCVGLVRVWSEEDARPALVFSGQAVFLVFLAAYAATAWSATETGGGLRATHGRYFFVTIGFLLLAFGLPAAALSEKRSGNGRLWIAALAVLAANETLFFLLRVLPFYRGA